VTQLTQPLAAVPPAAVIALRHAEPASLGFSLARVIPRIAMLVLAQLLAAGGA